MKRHVRETLARVNAALQPEGCNAVYAGMQGNGHHRIEVFRGRQILGAVPCSGTPTDERSCSNMVRQAALRLARSIK